MYTIEEFRRDVNTLRCVFSRIFYNIVHSDLNTDILSNVHGGHIDRLVKQASYNLIVRGRPATLTDNGCILKEDGKDDVNLFFREESGLSLEIEGAVVNFREDLLRNARAALTNIVKYNSNVEVSQEELSKNDEKFVNECINYIYSIDKNDVIKMNDILRKPSKKPLKRQLEVLLRYLRNKLNQYRGANSQYSDDQLSKIEERDIVIQIDVDTQVNFEDIIRETTQQAVQDKVDVGTQVNLEDIIGETRGQIIENIVENKEIEKSTSNIITLSSSVTTISNKQLFVDKRHPKKRRLDAILDRLHQNFICESQKELSNPSKNMKHE